MGGDKRFGIAKHGKSRGFIFAFACLAMLAGGCSKSEPEKSDNGTLDTSRLPRVAGAKEVFASPATTIFTSPDSVAQTADTVDKALATGGWQKYVAPNTAYSQDPKMRATSLKKGTQALSVFITIAPAQNNATSVQFAAVPLKNDLPFPKDATDIEFDPNRPLLTAVTAEPIDKTLDFYSKELGDRGWSLWSDKLDAKQPASGPSGEIRERGGSAEYVNDKEPTVTLVLTVQNAEAGKFKVELKEWPIGISASMHRAYVNGGTNIARPVDVSTLPRLEGAKVETARSSSDRLTYVVPGSVTNTIAATKKLLAAGGWKQYVTPLEEPHPLSLTLKKGAQGLSLFFTMPAGPVEQTGVDYSPARLGFALPFPDDATDIVFDENRPYLNCITAGTIDATLDFFRKEFGASGWSPLSAKDAASRWPNAKLDEKITNGAIGYYISENQRPIVLSLQRRDDGKTVVEIKVPSFALPQTLAAGQDIFGLPRPERTPSAGGTGGSTVHELHANVAADVSTVLAFYHRELAARHWNEEIQGAVLNPDEVMLKFSSAEGTAVLKLGHKYDLTTVSLVQQLPKPAAKVAPAAKGEAADSIMNQTDRLIRDAIAEAQVKSPKVAQAAGEPVETLHARAGNDAPVPIPDSAEDVEFDGADGQLEFNSASSLKAMADFYRSAMKQQGWEATSSVINNANLVVLDFAKAHKAVSLTIMKMGNKTNLTADGSGLKVAATKPAAPSGKAEATKAPAPASAEDLEAEESQGLPVPKRHTMSEGTKTPFRRDLKASVPLALNNVLGFYRRELGRLNWKEETKGTVVAADNAAIAYTSPDGPALLKLGRKDGATSVELVVKNTDAAAKAGLLPKPGQVKIMFGNINSAEAAITFDNKTLKVAAGAGTKGPDGPLLDLAPGKYKYSIKLPGKPAQSDEVEVGADETWGLMIGPGGVLALQTY
jgi:hypothetical protein